MKRSAASVAVLSLVLVPLMVLIPSSSASALPITPPNLPVVNVLPSTVVGAAGRGLSMPEALIKMLANGSVDAPIWKLTKAAEAAKLAGTATSTELALIESTAANFAPMSTRMALMTRAATVAGPAAVLVSGFYVGLGAGNTAMRMIGFNDKMVCQESNGILTAVASFTNNTDCTAYQNTLAASARNADAPSTVTSARFCLPDGTTCAQVVGVAPDPVDLYSRGYSSRVVCMAKDSTAWNTGAALIWLGSSGIPDAQMAVNGLDNPGPCTDSSKMDTNGYGFRWLNLQGNVGQVGWPFTGWRFAGESAYTVHPVTTVQGNPDRTFQCKVTNTDGTTATMFSKTWTQNDPVFGVPECPATSPGKVPDRVEVGQKTGDSVIPLINEPTTPEWKASRANYPDCGTGLCGLELTPTSTPQTTCHADPTLCAGWFTDPNKTTKYNCTYGAYAVPLTECTTYAPTFEPSAGVTGQTLGDPETGAAGPQTTANGDPTPGRSSTGQCFPSGWAVFNPIEWVLKPVVCALQSAFVPSPTSITDFQGKTQGSLNNSSVPLLKSSLGLVGAAFAQGTTECKGPAWAVNMTFAGGSAHQVYYPLSACEGTMQNLAFTVRNIGSVFVGIFALLACIRYVAAIFGYIGFTNGKADDSKVSFKGGETA